MLYKFKSPSGADVIMTQGPAEYILAVIGKGASAQGIITPEQIPAAIAALRAEVAKQEREKKEREKNARNAAEVDAGDAVDDASGDAVLFSQRVVPLIHLMEVSLAEGKGVIWGG